MSQNPTVLEVEALVQPHQHAIWSGLCKRLQQLDMKQALPAILSIAVIVICFSAILQMPVSAQNGETRHLRTKFWTAVTIREWKRIFTVCIVRVHTSVQMSH